jgi:hypothetical protein
MTPYRFDPDRIDGEHFVASGAALLVVWLVKLALP